MPIFLTIGFPIHFANRARSTPHGIGHKMSTVLSREVIEPILETRKVGLQHMLKGKKSETLALTPPPYRLKAIELETSDVMLRKPKMGQQQMV